MKKIHILYPALLIAALMILAVDASAQVPGRTTVEVVIKCNNQNIETSVECKAPVEKFEVNDDGSSQGTLTSGKTFTQSNISNELGVRLQKFVLENAFWYITDRGVIHANTDVQALSIYLSRV